MAYEILVLDIDGTLTNKNKIITEATREAILKLQENGQKVVLASGRPTPGVLPLAKELKLEKYGGYILSFNGAKIIHAGTQEIIYNAVLPRELIGEIYQAAVEYGVGIISYEKDEVIVGNGLDEYNQLEARINNITMKEVDNFTEYITFDVNKCLLTGEPEYLATVEEKMKKRFGQLNIYRSEPFFLEIMPPDIDKAYSLGKLLKRLGLNRKQMICCGDGYNDLSMIQYAGLGVAMANAQTEVKEAADYITLSNEEDGVVHVIEKFMMP